MARGSTSLAPSRTTTVATLAFLLLVVAGSVRAASVSAGVSSRRVDVGLPFTFSIEIDGAQEHDAPELPEIPGVEVLGPPSASTRSIRSILNGRVTESSTVTLSWTLVAQRVGPITIPAITVRADGRQFETLPIAIVAGKPDAGDLLFAEIAPARPTVYLGEPVALTLRVWIKPYRDEQIAGPLSSETMWSLVDLNRSNWGDFLEPIRDLSGPLGRRRALSGRPVARRAPGGEEVAYYLFEIQAKIWPTQAGAVELQPVAIVMEYPTRLERSRSIFSRGELQLASSRTIVAAAEWPAVEVRTPPEAGRPPFYTGAVGRYDLEVSARPLDVAVGDPITLQIALTDRTPGGSRLELLSPPPLGRLEEITRDFRVPADPLAGVVSGRTKTFTQTLRADDDTVDAVPAIPFAYFDPEAERYVVVTSDPIPLTVKPASTLSMADVVGVDPAEGAATTELTAVSGGLRANASGVDALLATTTPAVRWWHGVVLAVPPVLFVFVAAGQRHVRRRRNDTGYARRRAAASRARRRLAEAGRGGTGVEQWHEVGAALGDYVADRCNAPAGALTRAEVVERLARSAVPAALVSEVDALLVGAEQARFAGAAAEGDPPAARATRCITQLERERLA